MKRFLLPALLLASIGPAYAWDCSVWTSNVPGMECYKPPAKAGTGNVNTNTQSQSQQQEQSQVASGGAGGAGGAGGSASANARSGASANNAGNSQTSNYTSINPRQAPSVAQGGLFVQGCGVGGNAGGSGVPGSAFLGLEFTPKECYLYIQAQAYFAVGERQAACQILNLTKSAKRLREAGVALPDCFPPLPPSVDDIVIAPPLPQVLLLPPDPVTPVVVTKPKVHKKKVECKP